MISIETIGLCFSVKEEDNYRLVIDKDFVRQKLEETNQRIESIKNDFVRNRREQFEASMQKIEQDFFRPNFNDILKIGDYYKHTERNVLTLGQLTMELKIILDSQV